MPEITAEVVDGGVVAVHWDIAGDGRTWRPLPWLFQFNDLVVSVIGYVYSVGSIGLQASSPDAASTAGGPWAGSTVTDCRLWYFPRTSSPTGRFPVPPARDFRAARGGLAPDVDRQRAMIAA